MEAGVVLGTVLLPGSFQVIFSGFTPVKVRPNIPKPLEFLNGDSLIPGKPRENE